MIVSRHVQTRFTLAAPTTTSAHTAQPTLTSWRLHSPPPRSPSLHPVGPGHQALLSWPHVQRQLLEGGAARAGQHAPVQWGLLRGRVSEQLLLRCAAGRCNQVAAAHACMLLGPACMRPPQGPGPERPGLASTGGYHLSWPALPTHAPSCMHGVYHAASAACLPGCAACCSTVNVPSLPPCCHRPWRVQARQRRPVRG